MEKLEKIVWIVAGVAVVFVVAFIFVGPLKSEQSKEAVDEAFKALNDKMKAEHAKPEAPGAVAKKFGGPAGPASGPSVARVDRTPKQATPGRRDETTVVTRTDEGHASAGAEQPPQWQPPQGDQNVAAANEAAPVYIPQAMADKYQHFEDLVELGQSAAGEDYVTPQGEQAYLLRGINEDSPLSRQLNFQPGDIIISVNGYAPSRGNARQLWSTLRGAKDFQIVVERGGSRMTMPYHIR